MSEKNTAKIPPQVVAALANIVAKDPVRPTLQHIHVTERYAEATDGYVAAWIPIESKGIVDVLLLPSAFVSNNSKLPYTVHPATETERTAIEIPLRGTLSVLPPVPDQPKFPDLDAVVRPAIERPDEDVLRLHFTVNILARVLTFARKMGGEFISFSVPVKQEKDGTVECEGEKGVLFRVSSDPPAYGMVMPARRVMGEKVKVIR